MSFSPFDLPSQTQQPHQQPPVSSTVVSQWDPYANSSNTASLSAASGSNYSTTTVTPPTSPPSSSTTLDWMNSLMVPTQPHPQMPQPQAASAPFGVVPQVGIAGVVGAVPPPPPMEAPPPVPGSVEEQQVSLETIFAAMPDLTEEEKRQMIAEQGKLLASIEAKKQTSQQEHADLELAKKLQAQEYQRAATAELRRERQQQQQQQPYRQPTTTTSNGRTRRAGGTGLAEPLLPDIV